MGVKQILISKEQRNTNLNVSLSRTFSDITESSAALGTNGVSGVFTIVTTVAAVGMEAMEATATATTATTATMTATAPAKERLQCHELPWSAGGRPWGLVWRRAGQARVYTKIAMWHAQSQTNRSGDGGAATISL